LNENLASVVNDRSRKVHIRGKQAIVPMKFDKGGNVATDVTRIYKTLSLNDLRFLKVWKESRYTEDIAVLCNETGLAESRVETLCKRLAPFREEDARVKVLCEIPTASWITAQHVQNKYENGVMNDSVHKSMQELAKINGAYKTVALPNQLNVFNISLTPEQEARLKPVYDAIAMESNDTA
jgi:hypothetical protein